MATALRNGAPRRRTVQDRRRAAIAARWPPRIELSYRITDAAGEVREYLVSIRLGGPPPARWPLTVDVSWSLPVRANGEERSLAFRQRVEVLEPAVDCSQLLVEVVDDLGGEVGDTLARLGGQVGDLAARLGTPPPRLVRRVEHDEDGNIQRIIEEPVAHAA